MADDSHNAGFPYPMPDLVKRSDPDRLNLLADVKDLKDRMGELERSNVRQERYLVGGWSDDGVSWVPGVRERVEDVSRKQSWLLGGVWTLALMLAGDIVAKLVGITPHP